VKPFGLVSASLMRDPELSISARLLYALLKTYTSDEKVCFPSSALLGKQLGLSRRTIQRLLDELKNRGVVVIYGDYNPETKRRSRLIKIVDDIGTEDSSVTHV
jgi:hypothetical protein